MADLALSLTKTAVEGTVGRVLQAIDEDKKLKTAAQQDLRFIVDEFQVMQAFLKVAKSNKERTSNEVVKVWVRHLRDLAFDVEDCVEFVINLDTTPHRWPWLWRFMPLPSRMTPAWVGDLDSAVAQLRQLKARVEEVSQRNTRYSLLGGDDSASSTVSPPVLPEQLDAAAFPSTVDILRDLWKANFKQSSSLECNLKYLVTQGVSNKLEVISVWRSEGVDLEAAHILDTAYIDPEICQEFKVRARVKLMHPFNVQEFLKSLLNQLDVITSHQQDTLGEDLIRAKGDIVILQDKLRQLLSEHKYLVILEDLSSAVEWDLIRFCLPDRQNGSRIVISTQQLGIALSCTGEPYRLLQLALLPSDRYIYAFYQSIGTTELVKQMGQRRVISLWGDKGRTASHVRDMCETMKNCTAELKGINFKEVVLVDVPYPFSMEGFCQSFRQSLPWYQGYDDPKSYYFARRWMQEVCQDPYLFIIDGLQSKEDWDSMKDAGLVPEDTMSCIIIIANKEAVAKHCEDSWWRKIGDTESLEQSSNSEAFIGPLSEHKTSCIGISKLVCQLNKKIVQVWGDEPDKASIVRDVYEAIKNKAAEFKGVHLEDVMWIDVPSPFSLERFCRCLPSYIKNEYRHPKSYFDNYWSQKVCETPYLIVIKGLQSEKDWDLMKDEGLVPDDTKSCIIIIANEEAVSQHCRDSDIVRYRTVDPEWQEVNNAATIDPLFAQKTSGIGIQELAIQLGHRRVISLWGDEGRDRAGVVRDVFQTIQNGKVKLEGVNFKEFQWVDVPNPFSLESFCWWLPRYVEDRYCDPKSYFADYWSNKVCKTPCLYVLDGLRSKENWDSIKDAGLVPEDTMSCILIIANEAAVAKHCEHNSWRKMDNEEGNAAIIRPFSTHEEKYYSWDHNRFGNHGCSRRMEDEISQFAKLITPEQNQSLRRIIWFTYHGANDYRVIAVWGASGVGKSALVRFCYYPSMAYSLKFILEDTDLHEMVMAPGLQFERHGWAGVPEPFDLAEFARRLLLDFSSYDPVEMEKTAVGIIQGHNAIQQCYEIIRKYKCQVVIDGLRSTCDWESIKQAFLCHHHKDSCILVISTDESVAKHCATNKNPDISIGPQRTMQRIIHINALDDTSALELFKEIVNKRKDCDNDDDDDNGWTTQQKLKHADHIVPKCGGLPKIIDAVAKSDRSFWENTNDDLVTKFVNDPQFGHLKGVFTWMHSYFDGCSDSVKPCVFYLSVFPTNYKIRKTHLLRRWIAEGYCRDTTGSSAKENAEGVFHELVKLGIIQKLPGMPWCQISGFFREYMISQPMEDNLVFVLEGDCKRNSQCTVQHLTIMESWEREQKNVFEMIDISRLRSLTVYGKWQNFFVSDNKMKRIRVLDLEGISGLGDDELMRIFGILLNLKFISLRGCKSVTCLPKTVGGLRQLENLDVRGTSIVTLPPAIVKLQKIKYIRAGKFLPDEEGKSATSETAPTLAEAKGITNGGTVDTSPPQATDSQDIKANGVPHEAKDSDGGPSRSPQSLVSQDKQADGAREKTPPNNNKVFCCWTSRRLAYNGAGVEVPEGIEDMPALHTLGTVNISSARGMDFLRRLKLKAEKFKEAEKPKEAEKLKTELPRQIEDMPSSHTLGTDFLTKLKLKTTLPQITTPPQLLKLSVCGINKDNWKGLCDALLALHRLESLSLGFDKDFPEDSCFKNPPKTLKSLELYGHIRKSPAWIKDRLQDNLEKFDLEVIISSQGDLDQLLESLPNKEILRRLCIKPTPQVISKLKFNWVDSDHILRVLKIDCRSQLEVVASRSRTHDPKYVDVLIIHCSKGSSFRISLDGEKDGWSFLDFLQTVWLQGYDETEKYVADLKKEIATLQNKPVFKFEKLKSA